MAARPRKDPRFDPTPDNVNEALQNATILHSHFLERLKGSEANAVLSYLDAEVYSALEERISRGLAKIKTRGYLSGVFRQKQLEAMLDQTERIIQEGYRELYRIESESLTKIAKTESQWVVASTARATAPIGIVLNGVDTKLLHSMVVRSPFEGDILKDWYGGLAQNLQTGVAREIRNGLAVGDSVPTMTRALRGVVQTNSRQAESLVRTSVTHVTAQAREMTYEENEDLVKGVKWVSTLDSRTTPICISLDGQEFRVGEGQRPPAHHQCRSTTTPILRSWKELGLDFKEAPPSTRAARFLPQEAKKVERAVQQEMTRGRGRSRSQAIKNVKNRFGGQVPEDLTYPQWLRRQPASIQDEVLGPTRGRLLRSGQVSVDGFISNGRLLTLEQLRKREGLD